MKSLIRCFVSASLAIALVAALASISVSPAEAGPKGGGKPLSGTDLGSTR
ncbi:MAG: hypothetical protein VX871_00190 [Pseudomonadota bacterium]|nr:hypothetical protein [Pseudomonadota bacterium]